MIGFCPLASGSKGNSLYIGTDKTRLLIDAGLSVKALKEKLSQINVDLSTIEAILVTHEHSDHILGIKNLSTQYGIPVFANSETAKGILEVLDERPKFKIFTTGDTFEFQDLEIHPFSIRHDTYDPVAFTIKTPQAKIGICADLGVVTSLVEHHLKGLDYLYIEANHEINMVHASSRPQIYKQRVLGPSGHLSNEACGKLIAKVMHNELKTVYLAHLSSECNSEEMAMKVVSSHLPENIPFKLLIASQNEISEPTLFSGPLVN